MEQYVRAISARAEFSIVVLIAFGYFVYGSIHSLLTPSSTAPISEAHLQFLLVFESVVLIALCVFLAIRGWTFQQVGLIPSVKDTVMGAGIVIAAYAAYLVVWIVFSSFVPGLREQASALVAPGFNLLTVISASALNSLYEEIFVCGYVITALKKTHSITFAINVSIGIRLAYHLYQGMFGIISIIPVGFVFAYWFAKTGRLWPVVVAHALFDFLGLLVYL